MNYQIRPMTPQDVANVFEIDQQTAGLYWPLSSYRFETEENTAARNWVAEDPEGKLLGFLILWLIMDEIHVANFAVEPNFRQRGIGRALLEHGLKAAWEEGARTSFLEVRSGNKGAISLYEKMGYEEAGIRKSYYQDNHEDAILMTLYPFVYQNNFFRQETQ